MSEAITLTGHSNYRIQHVQTTSGKALERNLSLPEAVVASLTSVWVSMVTCI